MRNLSTFSILSIKLMYLICFGAMGLFINTEQSHAQIPPCHGQYEATQSPEKNTGSTENCETCQLAKNLWSCPFSLQTPKIKYPAIAASGILPLWEIPFLWENQRKQKCPHHHPPDKIISFSELTIKNTTQIIV